MLYIIQQKCNPHLPNGLSTVKWTMMVLWPLSTSLPVIYDMISRLQLIEYLHRFSCCLLSPFKSEPTPDGTNFQRLMNILWTQLLNTLYTNTFKNTKASLIALIRQNRLNAFNGILKKWFISWRKGRLPPLSLNTDISVALSLYLYVHVCLSLQFRP